MRNNTLRTAVVSVLLGCSSSALVLAETPPPDSPAAMREAERLAAQPPVAPSGKTTVDASGRTEKGKGSFYADKFSGRTMADGRKMDPQDSIAASKTLPLGSTAKVTNLGTGKSATVKIQDREPFVDGRVVDVSPRVAERLEMKEQGVSPVEVKPITVPQKDGGVKLGAGAAKASPQEVRQATETTKALAPRASTGAR